jgi:hypothetical protein
VGNFHEEFLYYAVFFKIKKHVETFMHELKYTWVRCEDCSYPWERRRLSIIFHSIRMMWSFFYRRSRQTSFFIKVILDLFFRATGLVANFVKSQVFPIRCDARHTDLISETVLCGHFFPMDIPRGTPFARETVEGSDATASR